MGHGATAQYTYNALNQRVQTVVGSVKTEFVYNANGQRDTIWNGSNGAQIQGQYYWGSKPVAFYYLDDKIHFQHQDWLGTERLRTSYNGAAEATFTSLPFGDGQTASGSDQDPYHFATLDSDSETTTDHAQFRQYNSAQGRWMRPDPYAGSYYLSNPQSMNRYVYALDNPLTFSDPSGLVCSLTILGVNNDQGEYGTAGAIYPYSGDGLLGALGSIFEQSMLGPNNATMQVVNAINQNSSEPGGIALIGFSGGAQAISSAIQSGLVNSSTISSITYLSPGLGLFGNLASVGDTASFAGSGFLDSLATLNARLSGVQITPTGCKGHNFICEYNNPQVQNRISGISPCRGASGNSAGGNTDNYNSWLFWLIENMPSNGNGYGPGSDYGPGSGWCPDCGEPVLLPRPGPPDQN